MNSQRLSPGCLCPRGTWSGLFRVVLFLWLAFPQGLTAATLLFSHSGSVNPTTEGWSGGGASTVQAVTSGGVEAWQVFDPGTETSSRTYAQSFSGANLTQALTVGWQLSAKIEYVQPTASATGLNNNAWCTVLINEGVVVDGAQRRTLFGLYFGNDASGNTLVGLYTGFSYTVSSGIHDYYLAYDPALGTAAFYIDGVLKTTSYNGLEIANTSTSQAYWGDNSSTLATPARGANYAYVGFSVGAVPEPSKSVLALLALMTLTLRRRR